VTARFVGHPLADYVADTADPVQARKHLGIATDRTLVALLPGSRVSEVKRLAPHFLQAAAWCHMHRPDLHYVVPLTTGRCREAFEQALADTGVALPMTLLNGHGLESMAAADVVLLASGTATLECMLLKRPMVVAYRVSPLTYQLARLLVRTDCYSLPNLLAGKPVVREFIQHDVTAESLGREIISLLENPQRCTGMMALFSDIHDELRRDASHAAADMVLQVAGYRGDK
jgi:lipid-A-disaccharide synthase